jgi:hypothetical protein
MGIVALLLLPRTDDGAAARPSGGHSKPLDGGAMEGSDGLTPDLKACFLSYLTVTQSIH